MSARALTLALCLVACQSAPPAGAACARSTDCSAPLVCRYGRCRTECGSNRDCGPSQSCILGSDHAGVCQLDVDLGCETGVGRECPPGLVCANDRCINECATAADCPTDGVCRFSPSAGLRVCVDPGRMDPPDAGPRPDAGIPTGSPCALTTDVCLGDGFGCAVRDGFVHCWGDDGNGQHGDLRTSDVAATQVLGPDMQPLAEIRASDCGATHACAIDARGNVLCWGNNAMGQLGNQSFATGDYATFVRADLDGFPLEFPEGTRALDATRLRLGSAHSCAQRGNGHWICWGSVGNGELTLGMATGSSNLQLATYIMELDDAAAVGIGDTHVCFAPRAGGVVCHGATGERLGDATQLGALGGVHDLAAGLNHGCALTGNGIVCWGSDIAGQLGDGAAMASDPSCGAPCSLAPIAVALPDAQRLVADSTSDTVCAITNDGGLWCWGLNQFGQVGPLTGANVDAPLRQAEISAFVCDAAIGQQTVCAVVASDTGGDVLCWGGNGAGQLATTPDADPHPVPVRIALP